MLVGRPEDRLPEHRPPLQQPLLLCLVIGGHQRDERTGVSPDHILGRQRSSGRLIQQLKPTSYQGGVRQCRPGLQPGDRNAAQAVVKSAADQGARPPQRSRSAGLRELAEIGATEGVSCMRQCPRDACVALVDRGVAGSVNKTPALVRRLHVAMHPCASTTGDDRGLGQRVGDVVGEVQQGADGRGLRHSHGSLREGSAT